MEKKSKKKVVAKKKKVGKPTGRKFVIKRLGPADDVGTIHSHNYYVREDKRDFINGRPTKYNNEILVLANKYLQKLPSDEVIHTIAGLADYLMVGRARIYEWCKDEDKAKFRDIVDEIMSKQEKTLVSKGLNKMFDSPITKLMMGKHGYRDQAVNENHNTDMNNLSAEDRDKINGDLKDVFS